MNICRFPPMFLVYSLKRERFSAVLPEQSPGVLPVLVPDMPAQLSKTPSPGYRVTRQPAKTVDPAYNGWFSRWICTAPGNTGKAKKWAGIVLALGFAFFWSNAASALTQTASPTACVDDNSTGTRTWSNPTRAFASDNNYATASVDGTTTHYLRCTGYGFTIPTGATINGITVSVERRSSSTANGGSRDAAVRVVKGGVIGTTDRSTGTTYPTSDTYEDHGGATDLWGTSWTPTDINAANFGAAFASTKPSASGGSHTISVDHIQITVDYTFVSVTSINLASPDPTSPGTTVSWAVVFNTSVTGVDVTDFVLVPGGGVTGASITSVTGSGTAWTVTANTGSGTGTLGLNLVDDDTIVDGGGNALGGSGAGNGDFTGQVYTVSPPFCSPPSNIPAGVTVSCVCDQFGRASLNPSTIYGANWIVSTSDATGIVPYINASTGHLRLTENTGNNAKAATVPGIFPATGNYISVEFQHYAYSGSGADGIAVTLSDYSVPAVPGAFGGSLGYAQRTTPSATAGFAGGWIGVALDEYGNYQNPTEGRVGGPGFRVDSVGVRGSGSGMSGYNWMAGTNTLAPGIDNTGSATPAPGYYYQVIVDARNEPTSTSVTVNRDTGSGYTQLINIPDVYTAATAQGFTQDPVPTNWQISFTGSTGGSTNIHEIGGLRICAQTVAPPSGGTASGFNAIDEAYGTPPSGPAVQSFLNGHIYMKLMGTAFKLNVAALNNNQILTTYAAGGNKNVTLKLVDNSDGACILDNTQANYCNATCTGKTAVTGGSQTLTFTSSDSGKKQSADFTLNTAYQNLVAIMSDGTTTACSTDAFSVRPTSITSVTSSNATQTGASGTPTFKAGADNFSLTATIAGVGANPGGYTGTPKINSSASVQAVSPAANAGALAGNFSAATSGSGNSTATGASFTYDNVGAFRLRGPDFAVPRIPGVYDDSWTAVDSVASKNDCVTGTTAAAYSNTKNASGKYGCYFGITADTGGFGRFIPAYFDVSYIHGCLGATSFTYSRQPFGRVTVTAKNAGGATTTNYAGTLARVTSISDAGDATNFTNNSFAAANFANGVQFQSNVTYKFPVKETAPATVTLRAAEDDPGGDGVSSVGHEGVANQAEIRSGRIHLYNAYGSELADLSMPMLAEYYSSSTVGWIANTNDQCSSVSLSAFTNYQGNLNAGETCVQDTGNPGISGQGCPVLGPVSEQYRSLPSPASGGYNLYLKAPGATNEGSVDLSADLSAKTWLRYDWDGSGSDDDPAARANFGLYRGSPKHIYMRERFN